MNRTPARAVGLFVVIAVVALLAAEPVRVALEQQLNPPVVAKQAAVVIQREAAERSLARGYSKAVDQLRSTANVRLPVTAAQAAAIQQRAVSDLAAVRRAALADLANASGLRGESATAYVSATEPKLGDGNASVGDSGALLAPGFFAIVSRADALFAQLADQATRELTTAPATPAPTR